MTATLIDRLHGVSEGVAVKRPCRAASLADIALSGLQTIDSVSLAENDRVLVRAQSDATRNGIYVASSGNWSRAADFDGSRDVVKGTRVSITDGVANANKQFVVTSSDPVGIGTVSIIFAEITENQVPVAPQLPRTTIQNKNASFSVTAADAGHLFNCDPTSGDIVATLLSAATATNGFRAGLRHVGTGNEIIIAAAAGEAINGKTSLALSGRYEAVWLVSDGTNWHIDGHARGFMTGALPLLKIADRLTSPPVSPNPGARYILNGTGTGDWSAFSQHDVLEANGQGGWIRYTPAEGWFAFVEDENLYTALIGTAWADQTGMSVPAASALKTANFREQQSDGVSGGTNIAGAWTARALNTIVENSIGGASLGAATITLPAGEYLLFARAQFGEVDSVRLRIKSTTTSTQLLGEPVYLNSSDGVRGVVGVSGRLSLAVAESFTLQYWATTARSTTGLGTANGDAEPEVYATVQVIDLTSLQGPAGPQGAQGPEGFAGLKFVFSNATDTASDPGIGLLRLNNANLALATQIAVDDQTATAGNPNVEDTVLSWLAGTSTVKSRIKLSKQGAAENFAIYDVTGGSNQAGFTQLAVTYVDHAGAFANADPLAVEVVLKGDKGDTGATGAAGATGATGNTGATGPNVGLDYQWNTATSGDPGAGKLLGNNATIASITQINISETNRQSVSQAAYIATFDDSTTTTARGVIRILDVSNPGANWMEFQINAGITDNGAYDLIPVSYIGHAGTIANNTVVSVAFFRTGNAGGGLAALVNDPTPQLGGNLSANARQVRFSKGADVASAAALTLGNDGNYFDITGTTAITSIATKAIGTVVKLHFDAALTLTHHATDLILPGGANIVTAAGDEVEFVEYAAGDWICTAYRRNAVGPDFEILGQTIGINTQTASYTLVLADKGKTVEMNVGSANNLTIPANASVAFPVGSYINVSQFGAGQTTLVEDTGVTIRRRVGLKLTGQYALATLYKRATNEWVAGGDLSA